MREPQILTRTNFGNPILRQKCAKLSKDQILSKDIQQLISDMRNTLELKQYGVGLAAPQVGRAVSISVIGIKPTPTRPNITTENLVIINPEVVEYYGQKEQMWEGCISFGGVKDFPYAKVPRHKKVKVKYFDERAVSHTIIAENLLAHVLQHEIDHLNGILFVDRVTDTKSYCMISEYKKLIKKAK
jgi:peptide deformylase